MARPKKIIDEKLLEAMATSHLPTKYIAETLGVSHDTLQRRYALKIQECRSKGKAKLVIKAQQLAEKGSVPMIKYLLGNHLGWSEKIETKETGNTSTVVVYQSYDKKKLNENAGD